MSRETLDSLKAAVEAHAEDVNPDEGIVTNYVVAYEMTKLDGEKTIVTLDYTTGGGAFTANLGIANWLAWRMLHPDQGGDEDE